MADRFHSFTNLHESLVRLVARHRSDLYGMRFQASFPTETTRLATLLRHPASRSPEKETLRRQNELARRTCFDAICALKADGVNIL